MDVPNITPSSLFTIGPPEVMPPLIVIRKESADPTHLQGLRQLGYAVLEVEDPRDVAFFNPAPATRKIS